jgi:hypothetical protein
MTRRPSRNQPLPPEEAASLNSLSPDDLIKRVYDLYQEGWTLQAIGDALTPPRPRSTVRSWLLRFQLPGERELDQEVVDAPIPTPTYKTAPGGYQKRRPVSPGILPDELELIRELAPHARQFRAKVSSVDSTRVANDQLSAICIRLHASGVSIKELAEAAGVTYRAMYKRIKLTK